MKQKFKRLFSAILAIVLVIGGLQVSGWTSKATTASAASPLNANYIYLDPTGMTQGNPDWTSAGTLYMWVENWSDFNASNGTTTINGKKLFYWDATNWDNMDKKFALLFENGWTNNVNTQHYYRTEVIGKLQDAKGKVFKWGGRSTKITSGEGHTLDEYILIDDTDTYADSDPDPTPGVGTIKRIYLDTTAYLENGSNGWEDAYIYLFNKGEEGNVYGPKQMNKVEGSTGVFYFDVDITNYPNVIFKPYAGNDWTRQTANQTIPTDEKNKFTCTQFGSITSGTWGGYGASTEGAFPSNVTGKATFFDLYTDHEITGNNYSNIYTGNEARSLTSILRAFDLGVNGTIDQYWRDKTTNGVTQKGTTVYPLYFNVFEPLYKAWIKNADPTAAQKWWASSDSVRYDGNDQKKAYQNYANWFAGRLLNFSWWVNRSLDTKDASGSTYSAQNGAVVQGLVDDQLDANGNITTGGVVLPQFNPDFYNDYKYNENAVGTQYPTVDFPFAVRQIGDVNYYQFDSGVNNGKYKDVVRFNADKSALLYYDGNQNQGQIVYGITAEGIKSPGFFPFNQPGDSSNANSYDSVNNKLNYGFGMKLEIQFTMNDDGTVYKADKSGKVPATFEFSGDDDVWIYVDGKLALYLGGDHSVATGKIDFSSLANSGDATSGDITSTVSYVKAKNGNTDLSTIYGVESSYKDPGYINQIGNNGVGSNSDVEKTIAFDKTKEIHTLTIFYEERGMFESNFKATFNLEQPTKLKVTNEVNVDNINPALQAATLLAAAGDEFEYALKDKNDAGVTKKYTDENGNPRDVTNGALTLKKDQSATFVRQFDRKAELSLVQTENSKYTTSWAFSEMNENEESGKTISASYVEGKDLYAVSDSRAGVPAHANDRFLLENKNIDEESVPARVIAQYVQNPKTGNISIKKKLTDEFESDDFFIFDIQFTSVFGSDASDVLAAVNAHVSELEYNVYNAADKLIAKRVATNGIKIQAGQRAEITNVSVGSTYKITERTGENYRLRDLVSDPYNNDTPSVSLSERTVEGTVVSDANVNGVATYDLFTFTNGEATKLDEFLVELDKTNTLAVIPDETVDGTLSNDLNDIATAYNNATTGGKKVNIVFVNENGHLETEDTSAGEKPKTSYTTDGVTYTVGTDNGRPIITFTPTSAATKGKNTVTVKYQLVEVDDNGIIKTKTEVEDGEGGPISVITPNIITPVITATNYLYKANNDIYVLDYGLDVDLADTATKYGLFQNDTLANPSLTDTISTYWNTAKNASTEEATASTTMAQNTEPKTGEYGTITPAAATGTEFAISNQSSTTEAVNPTVTYSLKKFLANKDYFHYNVLVKKGDATEDTQTSNRYRVNLTSNVTIMPASVVYYEDNFNAGTSSTDSTVKIVYTGTDSTGNAPILLQSNGQSEQYGHDEAYSSGAKDSAGSATALTANGYGTTAAFTFTGTGFDIIARTTGNSGAIYCIVEKIDENSGKTFITSFGVDTYYANGNLYQIPVIHENSLDYGTYKVTLGIKETTKGEIVYLDGIRIYNPLGTSGDSAYIDNEEGATVTRVSDLILGEGVITEYGIVDEDGDEIITGQAINGAKVALLDYTKDNLKPFTPMGSSKVEDLGENNEGSINNKSILTYLNAGPTNEMYLDDGSVLAFVATGTPSESSTIQIEAKLLNPSEDDAGTFELRYLDDGLEKQKIDTVTSSTAMYYKIPVEKSIKLGEDKYLVVILGNTGGDDGSQYLSFSNVKVKGYTLSNPLDDETVVSQYIDTGNLHEQDTFKAIDLFSVKKTYWSEWKYTVTVKDTDVFGQSAPAFHMYYVKSNDEKVPISVYARFKEVTSSGEAVYSLRFKAPNATGQFPVRLYTFINGKESSEYISTIMTVK